MAVRDGKTLWVTPTTWKRIFELKLHDDFKTIDQLLNALMDKWKRNGNGK